MEYPIRINKYLSQKKICSRREADELVREGKVRINGQRAELGAMVGPDDKVQVSEYQKKLVYYALNKPRGIVTHSAQKGEQAIQDVIKFSQPVFPLGRLDKDSTGLILMTNDGRVTDALLNPDAEHEKEYFVKVHKPFNKDFLQRMAAGVVLDDGYKTKKCQLRRIGDSIFFIILTEGKKRQIRRMCQSLGYKVVELERVRIMNILLNDLKPGQHRNLSGKELKSFLAALKLNLKM